MKKKSLFKGFIMLCATLILVTGCGSKNLTASLEDIMTSVYEGIDEDKLPMALSNIEITDENLEYYTGLTSLDYEEGIASESKVGSIAHSVVLLRVNNSVDIEATKKDIKEKVNPRKWVCVGVDDDENVIVDNIGNTIILVMDNEIAKDLDNNFKKLGE